MCRWVTTQDSQALKPVTGRPQVNQDKSRRRFHSPTGHVKCQRGSRCDVTRLDVTSTEFTEVDMKPELRF